MKRSKYVQLSLAASVAMAISGCGPTEKTYDLQKKYNFQSVQQCADEKLPVDVCSDAYMTAMAEHRRIAPVYDSQADCDADFVADWCQQDSTGKFIPRLGGFELTAEGQVTQSQVDAANAQANSQANSGGSGFSTSSLLTRLLTLNRYRLPVMLWRHRNDDALEELLGPLHKVVAKDANGQLIATLCSGPSSSSRASSLRWRHSITGKR